MTIPEANGARRRSAARLSVVLPVYNEAAALRELTRQLLTVLNSQSDDTELVFVNDGSSDGSAEILDGFAAEDSRIVVVHFARNFGHQPAVHAGLDHASGDVVIVMDSDRQDDPLAIPRFLDAWEAGNDVVYAERVNRKESLPKRLLFHSFYRVLNAVASIPIPADAGNFGLVDRRIVDALQQLPERDRYFPGLRSWTGFRQTGVPVERCARHDDQPRVSLLGLFRLAKTAVFSFSAFPLTLFYVIAALSGLVCCAATGFVLFHRILTGLAVPGWTSTIITASFFGALNALGISILGEYVIRIYDQVRNRPVYLTAGVRNGRARSASAAQRPGTAAGMHQLFESLEAEYSAVSAAQAAAAADRDAPPTE